MRFKIFWSGEEIKTIDQLKLFRKVFQPDKKIAGLKRNTDLISAAKAILAAYGLGPAVEKPSAYTERLQEYNPDMYDQLQPLIDVCVCKSQGEN